ncbi:toll-like receptor 13 isoform X2 [Malaya genurostris]|uniref:toll-like receptor 13 isoform X2 n=1 Tax=Malaya genurostris TaxID=325434 RepID=UPI0026F3BAB6|nr:toll-like receptor 13 isoform X2 [Malaya genurostris]XP_058457263.1 toll-like receptor 13 isoform X2 [Malaya genurostris]
MTRRRCDEPNDIAWCWFEFCWAPMASCDTRKDILYLSLAFNYLTQLPIRALKNFENLEYLSLMQNSLELAPNPGNHPKLPNLPQLTALDMRFCKLRMLPPDFFHEVPNLQFLFLGNNLITKLPDPIFHRLPHLIHLDLSHMDSSERQAELQAENPFMKLTGGMDLDPRVFQSLPKLRFLDLSFSKLELKAFIALTALSTQLEYASYCFTELPTLLDHLFIESIRMLDLSGYVGGGRSINRTTLSLLKNNLEILHFADSDLTRLDWVEELRALKVLNFRNNLVSSLEYDSFTKLENLEVLDVSHNLIQSWTKSVFFNNPKLEVVNLRHNKLLPMTSSMLEDLETVNYLALGGNPLQCSCNYNYLLRAVFENNSVPLQRTDFNENANSISPTLSALHAKFYDYNEIDYQCTNYSNQKKINALDIAGCSREGDNDEGVQSLEEVFEEFTTIYIIASCLVIFVMIMVILIYWNWFYIKYFCVLLKNSAILSFFNDDKMYLDKTAIVEETFYQYDVFVSYSDNDRSWVLDHMLPELEKEDLISVCLHERDFEVGYSILENIISCMDRSRCLMLIVSESFLLSRWCQFEMHLAQHRLLETRRDELILVLLEDLPKRKCPKTLSYLMKTKTYIKWPNERTHEQELFWKRLRKALLSSKC